MGTNNNFKVLSLCLVGMLFTNCNIFNKLSNKEKLVLVAHDSDHCDDYDIENPHYHIDETITYYVQPVVFTGKQLSSARIGRHMNQAMEEVNYEFKVLPPTYVNYMDDTISYKDNFDKYYRARIINLFIYNDDQEFTDATLEVKGAADGVPSLLQVSKGRPQLFMRLGSLYTNILKHELGHVFGLPHTFQGWDFHNRGQNCKIGDNVKGTLTPLVQLQVSNVSCKGYYPAIFNETYTYLEIVSMIVNPMSYSPENCMEDFIEDQILLMRVQSSTNPRLIDAQYKLSNKI